MSKPNSKHDGSSPLLQPNTDAVSLHSMHSDGGSDQNGSANSSSNRHAAFPDVGDDAPELSLDNDDLPPLYSEVVNEGRQPEIAAPSQGQNQSQNVNVHAAPGASHFRYPATAAGVPYEWRYQVAKPAVGNSVDDNVQQLLQIVNGWAQIPPRSYVQLRGTHSQTVKEDGKKETREVVDFDVKVELTPYLYSDARTYQSWRTLRTSDNHEMTRRGTVFRCQAPEIGGSPRLSDEEQLPANGADKPSLEDWCRRYCQDTSKLRTFQLERRMVGFDCKRVRAMMETLVGRTNYRGQLQVSFPVYEFAHVYYSDHCINHWRLTHWIKVLCALTFMFIFTWPFLFFATKRYEVVTVDWPFARITADGRKQYVSLSEEQWYNMWARAITSAVLCRRQATLGQEDLRRAEAAEPTFEPTGNMTVDGALEYMRASIHAMNQVNQQMGWGGDC
ncbi:hypothetical protein SEPCBS119000_003618 [Sporothrix epigloea]|uniref:ABC transporter n=1 Tax=Sporothrix epigloea TaxID=1892477 RepID=A0ABP0DRB7_9PEZI